MTDDTSGPGRHPFGKTDADRGRAPIDESSPREGRPALRAVDEAGLAPVIPLFGGSGHGAGEHPSFGRSATEGSSFSAAPRDDEQRARPSGRSRSGRVTQLGGFVEYETVDEQTEPDVEEIRARAEEVLVRKLRSRSLSLAEARTALRGVDGVDDAIVSDIIDRFLDLGYLDDASLAEQVTMSATERRGQGRRAVAQTLRKRGVPRDVADAAIAEMPDDDAERALEFARSKMRSVGGKDYDGDLRRLAGQLARRGYPSSVALTAARTALDEAGRERTRAPFRPSPSTGVRFTPDE